MGKVATIGAIFVILVIMTFGSFVYSYTQIDAQLNDVSYHSIDWTSFSWSTLLNIGLNVLTGNWLQSAFELIDGINFNLTFGLTNNGFFPVYVPNLTYDLYINNVPIGNGYTIVGFVLNPGNTKQVTSLQNFDKAQLNPAISSIINSNGIIDLHVRGNAHFKLLGQTVSIPFESSKQISILSEIENKLSDEISKNSRKTSSSSNLNLQLAGHVFIDSTYKVGPGSYVNIPFSIPCLSNIQGGFLSTASLGNDIIVYIFDDYDFNQYKNNKKSNVYYNSGKIYGDTFELVLDHNKYHIVLSNQYSDFSTKNVQLKVASLCY